MLENRFPEKRALITGAASGLGQEFARQLAQNGWRLFIADINESALREEEQILQAMGTTVISTVINVADHKEIDAAAERVKQEWGGLDILFNNAGVAGAGEMESLPLEEWKRLLDIDLWSVIYGCRAFIPMMKEQGGGYIVNTASSAGTLSGAQMANYNVAKAGVISLSETLKVELSPFNIGVTVICPTVFKTNLDASMKAGTAFERNLQRQVIESKISSKDIASHTFRKMQKNKLYVMTQTDALIGWRFKRYFPELYLKIMSSLYVKRKWIYAYLDE